MSDADPTDDDPPLLSVRGLTKHYPVRRGLIRRKVDRVRAVDGIDLTVRRGEALGLVGESGCGKSTAARTLLHLEEPTAGEVRLDGESVGEAGATERRAFRRRVQLLLQNPDEAFNPRVPVNRSVAEPLEIHGVTDRRRRERIVADRLERVGIDPATADRHPHEFSGGQKQRIALARALVFDPDLLVADEPTSALDERVQSRVLSLLLDLQEAHGLGVVFISHDVRVVQQFCDRVAVMYLGEIVERGPVEAVLEDPQHPYTRALVDAVPSRDPTAGGGAEPLAGEVPDPTDPPSGCRFHTRCPAVLPPAEFDLDAESFRGVLDLRLALEAGDIGVASLTAGPSDNDQVGEGLRDRFDIPAPLPDAEAEVVLFSALSSLADGERAAAERTLAARFTTPCEHAPPAVHETPAGTAACHLHDESYSSPSEP